MGRRLRGERGPRTRYFKYGLALSVSLAAFLVYLRSLSNGFVDWDDGDYVLNNFHIRSLDLGLLKWAFSHFYASNWHPLTWVSHALDYAIWGLIPLGHHLTNNILHAINSFLVVILMIDLLEIYRKRTIREGATPLLDHSAILIAGGVAGLLFGIHPIHVESVAWVAERKDLLCAAFFLLGIITYVQRAKAANDEVLHESAALRFHDTWYFATVVLYCLALLSKPMAVSFPVVLLILDWFPFSRIRSFKTLQTSLFEKLPLLICGVISAILTLLAQKGGASLAPLESIPFFTRLLIAGRSLFAYLGKIAIPMKLLPFYPYPQRIQFLSLEYMLPIVLIPVLTATFFLIRKRRALWMAVWGYYLITLLPVIGLVQVGRQSMADRYAYLPSIGPFLVIGLLAAWMFKKMTALKKGGFGLRLSCLAAGILLVLSLSVLSYQQIGIWKNSFTLWSYVVAEGPDRSFVAQNNLGVVYVHMGQLAKAAEHFDIAIRLEPHRYEGYYNRGIVFRKQGKLDRAIEYFTRAVTMNPKASNVYTDRGAAFAAVKDSKAALTDYNNAIEIDPGNNVAYYNKACLYSIMGDTDEACIWLEESIKKGYRDWAHIKKDIDLDPMRNVSCYKRIMSGK